MTLTVDPRTRSALVARLRAAGCVFAEEEADLLLAEAAGAADLEEMAGRRIAGLPLEQVLGWAEFCGLRVAVEPGVFVPRRRTALVVREAVAAARSGAVVVDLCCGSGAIGLAVASQVGEVQLHASDVDAAAVACARRNLEPVGGTVHEGDLEAALPRDLAGRVDVMVACPPYVPSDAVALMPPEARDHEPRTALDGGPDGLDLVRRIAGVAGHWLAPGGHVVVEAGEPQARAVVGAMQVAGLTARICSDEELGATAVVAVRDA